MKKLIVKFGQERFFARLQGDRAPRACELLKTLLPYSGKVTHARWSGEAIWSPLAEAWSPDVVLPPENSITLPRPGEVLLYAGVLSEPELLIPYGTSRFAAKSGPLEGSPVLMIEDRLDRISELGHDVLWRGAMPFSIEDSP